MLKSKNKNKQKNSGITLIALVITIIVLIILAGISVSLILGENGIIARAKTAKVLNDKADIEEKIKLSVFAAKISDMDENGEESIDTILLEEELNKYNITDITKSEDDNLPWTVKYNGYVFEIKEDGIIEEKDVADETPAESKVMKVGDFFEYDVEYTDMYYSSYNYTKTNGWRVQSFTDNGDGTYSDIKLMSTGIPAKLYYYYDKTNTWFGNETKDSTTNLTPFQTFLNSYGYFGEDDSRNNTYTFYTGSETYYSLKAATGLYHNFETIPFRYDTEHNDQYNKGFYARIKNGNTVYADSENSSEGATTTPNGGNLFRTNVTKTGADTIRLLTLPEVNIVIGNESDIDKVGSNTITTIADSIGVYRLDQLNSVLSGKTYSTGKYCLASHYPDSNYGSSLSFVDMQRQSVGKQLLRFWSSSTNFSKI